MPARKTANKKTTQKSTEIGSVISAPLIFDKIKDFKKRPNGKILFSLIVLGLLILAYINKGFFIAAIVNGQPITAMEVNQVLNKSYKDKVLSGLVEQKILDQEAAKKGIVITNQQVQSKIDEIANSYGGKDALNTILSQQGYTPDQFAGQIRIGLIADALYKDQTNPTDKEVNDFMEQNSSLPEATEPAKFKTLSADHLRQQKLQTLFNQKFQELKTQAKVQIF